MTKKDNKKMKKRKLKIKALLKLLLIILVFVVVFFYLINLKISNIYIKGNDQIKDIEIIKQAGIENYPNIYRLNIKKIKNNIKQIPLVSEVKIKRNLLGKITIEIKERSILFYYKYDNKFITEDGTRISSRNEYMGYPTLINFTPDTILEGLIKGLKNVDKQILKMINEMEYSPYKNQSGNIIDNKRFVLKMNDENTVYIDIPNIKNLNKYTTIIATPDMEKHKGIVYLDTINSQIVFRSYDAIKKEQEEETKKAEEQAKEENKKKEKEEKHELQ